jgi:integrase
VSALDPGKARDAAKDLMARVRLGEDPATEKLEQRARAGETFGSFLPRYLDRQRQRLRPNSFYEVDRYLSRCARPWHARPVSRIDRRDAATLITSLAERHGAAAANRCRSNLSSYFAWLIAEGLLETNPVAFTVTQPEAGPRQRVLSDPELAAVWKTAGDTQYGQILRLLILTAARKAEVGNLNWSEVDDETGLIVVPSIRTKNKRDHEIPLSKFAREILGSRKQRSGHAHVFGLRQGAGFGGWSKSKRELDRRLAAAGVSLPAFTVHDLRRSAATGMAELGIEPHIIEACLGHAAGHKAGVAGIYNVASYSTQKAAALQKWSDHIEALVTGKRRSTVVELPQRKRRR